MQFQAFINLESIKQSALTDTKEYKILEKHAIKNSRLTAYINLQALNKNILLRNVNFSNSPFDRLKQKIKSALFTSTSNKHLIKGSLATCFKVRQRIIY